MVYLKKEYSKVPLYLSFHNKKIQIYIVFKFCVLFVYSSNVDTTLSVRPYSISAKFGSGYIIPQRFETKQIIQGLPNIYTISILKNTLGKNLWEKQHNFPSYGLTFSFVDYKNPLVLGYSAHISPFFYFPFIRNNRWKLGVNLSWGLGYISKKFHPIKNFKNNVIGSHLNAIGLGDIQNTFKISNRLYFLLNYTFFHISNGSLQRPNQGINISMITAGLEYGLGEKGSIYREYKKNNYNVKKRSFIFQTLIGVKETVPIQRKKYISTSFALLAFNQFTPKASVGSGLETFYISSLHQDIQLKGTQTQHNLDVIRLGTPIYYNIHIHKLQLWFCWGIYIYDRYKTDGYFYHRSGISYSLGKKINIQLNLKTHYFKADYFEAGINYIFYSNQK